MTIRPAPGPQLSVGRIRVDAARAIAKLREYQLAERPAWILEAIRAAVAANATAIELTGDADDVWLAWHGGPIAVDDLPRLFDELVSPEATSERHHLRLLAAGVNSALGMDPAFVDIYSIDGGDDRAMRVRYSPEVLDEPTAELGESALQKMVATPHAAPAQAPARGVLVHLHRRVSFAVVGRFVIRAEPPELGVARRMARDIARPLRIGAETVLHRDRHTRDVVRIPLDEGLDGFIAVVDPDDASIGMSAVLEVAERGVVLVSYPIDLVGKTRAPFPIRVFVDAARMPTNASRSQVRRDEYPIEPAIRRARALLEPLIHALVATLGEPSRPPKARAAALALVAAEIAGPEWRWQAMTLDAPLRVLADLPLLRDATGYPRPVTSAWSGAAYTGDTPLDEDLRPWLEGLLWIPPGDPTERFLSSVDQRATRRHIRGARRQRTAHARFFAHAPRAATVVSRELPRARLTLGAGVANSVVDAAVFAGLTGEICVYASGGRGSLVVLHHGRELEHVPLDGAIAYDIVIDSPRVTAGERYRGVRRDAAFAEIEEVARAAVIRAIEVIAAGTTPPTGAILDGTGEHDAILVRAALGLVLDAKLRPAPPLTTARAWQTIDGRWVSAVELEQEPAIGLVPPGVEATVPLGRTAVRADLAMRSLLEQIVPIAQVPYTRARVKHTAASLAERYPDRHVFAIQQLGSIGVITPAVRPVVVLHHLGTQLAELPYGFRFAPCEIAIDDDALVPDAGWSRALDVGRYAGREFVAWETAMLRACAAMLVGERPAELLGPATLEPDSVLVQALFFAIAVRIEPVELLGVDLVTKLKAAPILRLLGEIASRSIDEVVAMFPQSIPYVARGTEPVAGCAALLAEEPLVRAIQKLTGLGLHDRSVTVELLRASLLRAARLAEHRRLPTAPLAIAGPHVALEHPVATGIVGVSSGELQIDVRVEARPFRTIRQPGLPLIAVVEIAVDRVDEAFGELPADVVAAIVEATIACTPALLVALSTAEPARFGERGPTFDLFLRWIAQTTLDREARQALRAIDAFPTVQGAVVSVEHASEPRNVVSTSTWEGDWLGPDGDAPSALDAPVVQLVGRPELRAALDKLHIGVILDVTAEIASLQANRRMARGLMPTPTLKAISPDLKCKLDELGALGASFGHGEIGLVADLSSVAFLHVSGVLVRQVPLDVLPPIHIAFEASELAGELERSAPVGASQLRALGLLDETPHPIGARVQELAVRLVAKLVTLKVPSELRRGLRSALLAKRLDPAEVSGVPLLELLDGTWVGWSALAEQRALFGDVWAVSSRPREATPLDPRRIVLLLSSFDIPLAREHGIVEATQELVLDATARRNRARAPAVRLEIPSTGILSRAELGGDGKTSPRGVVGLLAPWAFDQRGIHAHQEMRGFERMPDPCEWPTIVAVDDARFDADRLWERPRDTTEWRAALHVIRSISAKLATTVVEPPRDALVVMPVAQTTVGDAHVVGSLWLLADPTSFARIDAIGDMNLATRLEVTRRVAIGGKLYLDGNRPARDAVESFVEQAHGRLLHLLVRSDRLDHPATPAHLARGLALSRIAPADVPAIFTCFAPAPRDATSLARLFSTKELVPVIDAPDPLRDGPAVVDDGSPLARVVLDALGTRARRGPSAPAVPTVPEPAVRHAIQGVVDALQARLVALGLPGYDCVISEEPGPTVWFEGVLRIAGRDPRLRAIATAQLVASPWAAAAVDALAAHVVTLLNLALTDVTDVTEAHALRALLTV